MMSRPNARVKNSRLICKLFLNSSLIRSPIRKYNWVFYDQNRFNLYVIGNQKSYFSERGSLIIVRVGKKINTIIGEANSQQASIMTLNSEPLTIVSESLSSFNQAYSSMPLSSWQYTPSTAFINQIQAAAHFIGTNIGTTFDNAVYGVLSHMMNNPAFSYCLETVPPTILAFFFIKAGKWAMQTRLRPSGFSGFSRLSNVIPPHFWVPVTALFSPLFILAHQDLKSNLNLGPIGQDALTWLELISASAITSPIYKKWRKALRKLLWRSHIWLRHRLYLNARPHDLLRNPNWNYPSSVSTTTYVGIVATVLWGAYLNRYNTHTRSLDTNAVNYALNYGHVPTLVIPDSSQSNEAQQILVRTKDQTHQVMVQKKKGNETQQIVSQEKKQVWSSAEVIQPGVQVKVQVLGDKRLVWVQTWEPGTKEWLQPTQVGGPGWISLMQPLDQPQIDPWTEVSVSVIQADGKIITWVQFMPEAPKMSKRVPKRSLFHFNIQLPNININFPNSVLRLRNPQVSSRSNAPHVARPAGNILGGGRSRTSAATAAGTAAQNRLLLTASPISNDTIIPGEG